ncbi:MAG: HEAT repeat domain-containing protein, partial [Chthonomonadales bacterium]|nr:HEAT repeat domain-containing protein [Chthonomonadales bacterium]
VEAIRRAAGSGGSAVRIAAIRAAVRLGAEGAAMVAAYVGDEDPAVAAAAHDALATLLPADLAGVVRELLTRKDASSKMAGADLAVQRNLVATAPLLVSLLTDEDVGVRIAALRALKGVGSTRDLPPIADRLRAGISDDERTAVEEALAGIGARHADTGATAELVSALRGATGSTAVPLLRALGSVGGPEALAAVRSRLVDASAEVRDTAIGLLCDWQTPDAVPELLRLARAEGTSSAGIRCLRGALRLAGSGDLAPDVRMGFLREAEPLVTRDEERRSLLGALGGIPQRDAMQMARRYIEPSQPGPRRVRRSSRSPRSCRLANVPGTSRRSSSGSSAWRPRRRSSSERSGSRRDRSRAGADPGPSLELPIAVSSRLRRRVLAVRSGLQRRG